MKNFIMLTDCNGKKYGVSVSNIKHFEAGMDYSKVFFNGPICAGIGNVEWCLAKESVEEIAEKIEKAMEEKAEFIDFLFTNGNERLCVKISEIRYLKAGEGKTHKVFIDGMGEIEVYGDFNKIVEPLSSVTI